jgi:hypothetical protein
MLHVVLHRDTREVHPGEVHPWGCDKTVPPTGVLPIFIT